MVIFKCRQSGRRFLGDPKFFRWLSIGHILMHQFKSPQATFPHISAHSDLNQFCQLDVLILLELYWLHLVSFIFSQGKTDDVIIFGRGRKGDGARAGAILHKRKQVGLNNQKKQLKEQNTTASGREGVGGEQGFPAESDSPAWPSSVSTFPSLSLISFHLELCVPVMPSPVGVPQPFQKHHLPTWDVPSPTCSQTRECN